MLDPACRANYSGTITFWWPTGEETRVNARCLARGGVHMQVADPTEGWALACRYVADNLLSRMPRVASAAALLAPIGRYLTQ